MDLKNTTLGKALRLKKTMAQNIAEAQQRAQNTAVQIEGRKYDYDHSEQLKAYRENQANLRALKTAVAQKSVATLVKIPGDCEVFGVVEANSEVPVYRAILIRDDLKAQRGFLARVAAMPAEDQVRENYKTGETVTIKVERKFDFDTLQVQLQELQDLIDELDAAIQYTDATVKL